MIPQLEDSDEGQKCEDENFIICSVVQVVLLSTLILALNAYYLTHILYKNIIF